MPQAQQYWRPEPESKRHALAIRHLLVEDAQAHEPHDRLSIGPDGSDRSGSRRQRPS
jgi:hypothetical protein